MSILYRLHVRQEVTNLAWLQDAGRNQFFGLDHANFIDFVSFLFMEAE